MQALSEEKQKQILFIIALVGCVTGLASLGWNIYAATRPTLDKIAVTIPWLRVAEKDRLRIEVSNLGEKDVHIRAFFLVPHRVASFEQLYPKSGVSTIPPGGFQIFEFDTTYGHVVDFAVKTKAEVNLYVSTGSGNRNRL